MRIFLSHAFGVGGRYEVLHVESDFSQKFTIGNLLLKLGHWKGTWFAPWKWVRSLVLHLLRTKVRMDRVWPGPRESRLEKMSLGVTLFNGNLELGGLLLEGAFSYSSCALFSLFEALNKSFERTCFFIDNDWNTWFKYI